MPDNVQRHLAVCNELNVLYEQKNHDYGDSFHLSYLDEGMAMARIRLGDKLNRFKSLTKNVKPCAVDREIVRDYILKLAKKAMVEIDSQEIRASIRDALVYIADKVTCDEDSRFVNEDSQLVNDESIRDTLIDLANYAIMTVMEIDQEAQHEKI